MSVPPSGHQLRLLQGAAELFTALVASIGQAQHEVQLETYIFDPTAGAAVVAQALIDAARRGVVVHLMIDGVGTPHLPPDWRSQFDAAGVQVQIYSPLGRLGLLLPVRWRRLHRKLCVVDGRIAYCGGVNILDDYYDPNYGQLNAARLDFSVEVQGPLVRQVHAATTRLWWRARAASRARGRDLASAWSSLRMARSAGVSAPIRSGADGARAALVLRDNIGHRRDIERAYLAAIAAARHEIIIANAYFLPGRRLRQALVRAADRGVAVRVLLQGRYEYFMQYHAARPVYGSLLAAGVQIHEYALSFMHAKVAVIDAGQPDSWSTVGSSNLDPLSLLLAREANVMVRDQAFSENLRRCLEQAMAHTAGPLDALSYAQRSLPARLLDWLAYGLLRLALVLTGRRY